MVSEWIPDASMRLCTTGAAPTYSYDPNGNLTQKVEGGVTWTYVWDAENGLKWVCNTTPCTQGAAVAAFQYDALGRRVEKVAGGVTTTYTYDREDILRQIAGGSTLKFVHGPGIDEPLAQEDGAGALSYFHADGLGSIVKTTSSAGAVIVTRRYDAFGNIEVGAANGYAFTGREWDTETGLAYYRARYYDPAAGRFASEDPLRWLDGVNLYAYTLNRPSSLTDPYGTKAAGAAAAAAAAATAIVTVACVAFVERVYTDMKNPYEATIDPSQHLKHCIAECEITKNCPGHAVTAAAAGWLREFFGDQNEADKSAGAQGRNVAEQCPRESCLQSCERLLLSGGL